MTTDLIPVCVGACLCPDTPHADGDFVYLRPKLAWRHVTAIKWDILAVREDSVDVAPGVIMGILSEGYISHGIAEWTLPVALNPANIQAEILEDVERASLVGEAADELYGPQVLLPLARLGAKSSSTTSTNGSTSATNGSPVAPRKPSRRSSTTTSPMASTATITPAPDGDSSS